MGEFFSSFDDAWRFFLGRTDPLEDFFAEFSDDDGAELEGWLVEPPAHVKLAVGRVQAELAHLGWLRPVPDHFLHVWIGLRDRIGDAWQGWPALEPLSVSYARLNCFHSAVVVEVEGRIGELVAGTPNDLPTFLPHLTVAVAREPHPPDELRDALRPLRDSRLGEQVVREVVRVRFPASRTTLFRPWRAEQLVPLR